MPKLIHPTSEWIRSYPIRYQSLCPIRPKWIRPDPIPYRSLHIFFRNGPDPIRPDSELIHYIPVRIRSYPIRSRSLYICCQNVSDPIRSDTGGCTLSFGRDPIMSDPIPKLLHPLPEGIRSYPILYRTSDPLFRNGSDPIRSDTGAYTSSFGIDPTLSDPLPELIHYLPVWSRSYLIRSLSLHTIFRNGSGPIRSDAEAYTSSLGMDPILSDPIPELIPLLPEWIRPDPIPYRSVFIFFRNGPDPIRPDTGAYTLSSGAGPILSDPKPELIHLLPECIRS
jgi:hypothetical protein